MAENECPAVYRKADVTVMRLKHERVSARPLIPARRFSQLSDAARSARTHAVKSVTVKKLLCQSLAVIALASGEGARAAGSLPAWDPKAPAEWPFVSPARSGSDWTGFSGSDWTGFYVGGHAGVSGGHSAWSATQPGG